MNSVSPTPANSSPPPVTIPLQLSSEPSKQGRGPVVVGDEGGCSPAPAPSPPAPIFTEPTSKLSSDPTAKLSSVPTAKLSSDPTAKLSSEQVYPTAQLPSEPPQQRQQEVRGPTAVAVVGEVGSFPSHDIRERTPPVDVHGSDCRPLGAIIEEMTAICRKRKGEDFLPNLRRSENKFSTCIVCSRGSVCLGNSCLGTRRVSAVHTFHTICIIPGLAGDKSSSLLEREKTPSSKLSKIKISTDNKQTKS